MIHARGGNIAVTRMNGEPAKRITPLQAWMPRVSGAALLLFFVAVGVFRVSGLYVFFGVLAFVVGGTLFYRYSTRRERKRLGLPTANAMSDRVTGLAMQLRARATALRTISHFVR